MKGASRSQVLMAAASIASKSVSESRPANGCSALLQMSSGCSEVNYVRSAPYCGVGITIQTPMNPIDMVEEGMILRSIEVAEVLLPKAASCDANL